MATVLSTYVAFKNFSKIEPAITKVGVIPNLLFWLKLEEWRQRDLEIKEKIRIKKEEVDKLPWKDCSDSEKVAIKNLIDKTDGYYKIETYQKFVREIENICRRELLYNPNPIPSIVWEKDHRGIWIQTERVQKSNILWSSLDGDSYQFKNIDADGDEEIETCDHFVERAGIHKRNNTIFKIRCKFLKEYKTGKGNYENLGNYEYKNDEAKAQFLEEVEQKGLVRKAEPKKSTVEIEALDLTNQEDIVEPNNYFYNEETGDYEILREDEL